MRKINITKETVSNAAKIGGRVVLYGLATIMSCVSAKDVIDAVRYSGNVKYSDAINEIMNSNMYSSDKNKAIMELKKDGDSDFYRSIIKVVKSSMFSSDKIKTIIELSKEEA